MNVRKISLIAVIAMLVTAVGCSQNNNDKKSDSITKPNSARNVVVRATADGKKEFALVDTAIPEGAATPDEALLQSLNWQPLNNQIEGSHTVNPSQAVNESYSFIDPKAVFEKAAAEQEQGASSYYYGYRYPTYYANYGYYNYYYPTYGYNNWYWPSYNYSATWAYSYNYWPTYYNTYNWWYYQPMYQYNYWGYNYYWYNRWW